MSRSRRLLGVAAVSVVAAVVVALPSAGASGFDGSFNAEASAEGTRTTLIVPGVTVVKALVDAGSTSTQATLNNLGESRAFASIPYPGELAIVGPGTVAGATNGQINVPNYPLYAWSDHPARPGQEVGDGPYEMRAESDELSSSAQANAGLRSEDVGQAGSSRTASSITSEGEAVTATATSETSGFKVGPLEIGQVVSVAETVLDSGGTLKRKADTKVAGVSVAGNPVELTPAGVNAGGNASPPPDFKALNEAVKPAGLRVEVVPATETETGVVAPAVRVTQQLQEGSEIVYQLGSAAAFVSGTAGGGTSPDDITGDDGEDVTGPPASTEPDASGGSAPATPPAAPAESSDSYNTVYDPAAVASAPPALAQASGAVPAVSYPAAAAGSAFVTTPGASTYQPSLPAAPAEPAAPPTFETPSADASAGDGDREVASVPVLASRLLDGGDSRPFYAAFIVAAILGLAGVLGVALFSRALRSGV